MKNLKTNSLGLPAITELQLIERLHNICTSPDGVKQSFPDLFTGLGTLGVEYEIRLQINAKPYTLHTLSIQKWS